MDVSAFEIEVTRLVLWYVALSLIGFIATMYCLYLVVRAAVRDGIRDSRVLGSWSAYVARQQRHAADTLPPDFSAR